MKVTVLKGVTLNASDYSVYRSDTAVFDPMRYVDAYQTNPDGSTTQLGAYNAAIDAGISAIGLVDITTIGQYSVAYSAKNSMGIVEIKTVTVSVISEEGLPTVTVANPTVEVEVGTNVTAAMIRSWATASDPVDGNNLMVEYQVAGGAAIDTSKVGTYTIIYSYTNSAGNTATASMTLEIVQTAVVDKSNANSNTTTTTTKTTTTKTVSSAKTGDTSNAVMLMLALAVSALLIAGVAYFSKKKKVTKA